MLGSGGVVWMNTGPLKKTVHGGLGELGHFMVLLDCQRFAEAVAGPR